jgi:phospholipid/cholesterol/gamma-HCH transport system substrate-binding protein
VKLSKEVKVGLTIIAAICFFIYGFNFLKGTNLFSKNKLYYATYATLDGVTESNPVMLNGFKIGQVKSLSLQNKNGYYPIVVEFSLDKTIQVPKFSIAKVVSTDLFGAKAIELILSDSKEFLNSGDTLQTASEEDLKTAVDKRIAPLQKKAETLISDVDSVMNSVNNVFDAKTQANLKTSIESIKFTFASLSKTATTLDGLLAVEQAKLAAILANVNSITKNLENNNEKLTHVISNFSSISDSLAKSNLKQVIENTNLVMTQTKDIMAKVNSGKGTMGLLINNDSLYVKLDKTVGDLDKLLIDLKKNPGRYVSVSVFGKKDKVNP